MRKTDAILLGVISVALLALALMTMGLFPWHTFIGDFGEALHPQHPTLAVFVFFGVILEVAVGALIAVKVVRRLR